MLAILDYGVGNLFSLCSSLAALGEEACVTADRTVIQKADRLILPGVGAFGDAAAKLRAAELDKLLYDEVQSGKPLLGICLGMQLLFEESMEYGCHKGLALIPGRIVPMEGRIPAGLNIPHIGWNALTIRQPGSILSGLQNGDCVYFVHSYYAETAPDYILATAEYGLPVTAAVQKGNVYGCQFHPEKSGQTGLSILRAFCETEVIR